MATWVISFVRGKGFLLWLFLWGSLFGALWVRGVEAGFVSRFSLSASEEYNDNVFFTKSKQEDFITSFTPALSFAYAPPNQPDSTFTADLTTSAQLFAHDPKRNNFGDVVNIDTNYLYAYSPRLSFKFRDNIRRIGAAW